MRAPSTSASSPRRPTASPPSSGSTTSHLNLKWATCRQHSGSKNAPGKLWARRRERPQVAAPLRATSSCCCCGTSSMRACRVRLGSGCTLNISWGGDYRRLGLRSSSGRAGRAALRQRLTVKVTGEEAVWGGVNGAWTEWVRWSGVAAVAWPTAISAGLVHVRIAVEVGLRHAWYAVRL